MRFTLPIVALFLPAAGSQAVAACAPPALVRIEAADLSAGTSADDVARLPKVLYRLGNGQTRLEGRPNPADGEQLLYITRAPHLWIIDLSRRVGEHHLDTSSDISVHAPVFGDEGVPEEIHSLEFGCEEAFVRDPATTHERLKTPNGTTLEHSRRSGPWKGTLVYREGEAHPRSALLSKDGKVVMTVSYLSYEILEAVPEGLFAPPGGVEITEGV